MNKYEGTFTLVYSYSGYLGTGYTLTTQTNAVLESILTRDQYRRQQVMDVSTAFNNSTIAAHSYAFDGLGRATNAVRSVQPLSLVSTNAYVYNARSEVIGAGIDTNDYAYIYDNIGNSLFTSLNTVTNAYTVNNLNQYKAVTNLVDLTGFRQGDDADGNTTRIDDHWLTYVGLQAQVLTRPVYEDGFFYAFLKFVLNGFLSKNVPSLVISIFALACPLVLRLRVSQSVLLPVLPRLGVHFTY